jgi:16S rRNA (guanine527-N7)-methyltransferase
VEQIKHHFPSLSTEQIEQFTALESLYSHWNEQINVISRKDIENFYERHVLHSLGIAKVLEFKKGTEVLDVGTGGGFPGIPLAILFPDTHFTLVDSIGKKIKVVQEVASALGLINVTAIHQRAEEVKGKFDFVVSRAVTKMSDFIPWVEKKIKKESIHSLKNGILYLKGGELKEEMRLVKQKNKGYHLPLFYKEEFFETKQVVYVKLVK